MHIFYIDLRKCTLRIFFFNGNLRPHEDFSRHYQKQGFSQCQFFQSREPFELQGKKKNWFE